MRLDWLSFTYRPEDEKELAKFDGDIFSAFLEEFPSLKSRVESGCVEILNGNGGTHYQQRLLLDECFHISMNTEGDRIYEMGVHVSIPAHGLDLFFRELGFDVSDIQIISLMSFLFDHHCTVTRVDLCQDDTSFTYLPKDLERLWLEGFIKSRMRRHRFESSGGTDRGTFYVGSREAGKYLRVYDKETETTRKIAKAQGLDFKSAASSVDVIHAIRWEIELRGDVAKVFQRDCVMGLADRFSFGGVIRSCFEILSESRYGSDSNASRIPLDPKWLDFTEHEFCEEIYTIKVDRHITTKEEIESYVLTYQAASLGLVMAELAPSERLALCQRLVDHMKLSKRAMSALRKSVAVGLTDPMRLRKFANLDLPMTDFSDYYQIEFPDIPDE